MRSGKRAWIGIGLFVVITLVAGVVLVPWKEINPFYFSKEEKLRRVMVRDQMSRLATALESFKNDNGFYPTTEQGLDTLITRPSVPPIPAKYYLFGYINRMSVPKDPWGRNFIYTSPDGKFPYTIKSEGRVAWYGGDNLIYPEGDTVAKSSP